MPQAKTDLNKTASSAGTAMEALRASEEFKDRLLACSRDCIKVLDLEGRLVYMNEGGMQSLEICDLAPVLNNCWIDFWEGQDREAARAAVDAARLAGLPAISKRESIASSAGGMLSSARFAMLQADQNAFWLCPATSLRRKSAKMRCAMPCSSTGRSSRTPVRAPQ